MKAGSMVQVWVCSPVAVNHAGEISNRYVNLRSFWVNAQQDYSELDIAAYGQAINEAIKLRSLQIPPVDEGDHIYFAKPVVQQTVELEGQDYEDYGRGDYEVRSITPAIIGAVAARNPTVVLARKVTG